MSLSQIHIKVLLIKLLVLLTCMFTIADSLLLATILIVAAYGVVKTACLSWFRFAPIRTFPIHSPSITVTLSTSSYFLRATRVDRRVIACCHSSTQLPYGQKHFYYVFSILLNTHPQTNYHTNQLHHHFPAHIH